MFHSVSANFGRTALKWGQPCVLYNFCTLSIINSTQKAIFKGGEKKNPENWALVAAKRKLPCGTSLGRWLGSAAEVLIFEAKDLMWECEEISHITTIVRRAVQARDFFLLLSSHKLNGKFLEGIKSVHSSRAIRGFFKFLSSFLSPKRILHEEKT